MSAYDLANEVMEYYNAEKQKGFNVNWMQEVANMLRQQADRISVLEANDEIQLNIVKKQQDYIDQLEQGLRASIELNKAQAERQEK
jgi:hypothetical protein